MSYINNYVEKIFNPKASAVMLIDKVSSLLKETNFDKVDFSRIVGIETERLNSFFLTKGSDIYREEVVSLCLAIGIGLESIFGLPDIRERDDIIKEFEEICSEKETLDSVAFCGPIQERKCDIETMRSVLYLICIRKCLNKYKSVRT